MQAAVEAGNPPDVAYHTLPITQLYALNLVEDVSDVVAEVVKMYGDVVPVVAAKTARFDGKWWAVPFMSTSGAWFGRKDLFDAAGIDVNSLDTFDKRREAALKVSDSQPGDLGLRPVDQHQRRRPSSAARSSISSNMEARWPGSKLRCWDRSP